VGGLGRAIGGAAGRAVLDSVFGGRSRKRARTRRKRLAEQAVFTETQISDAMRQLKTLPRFKRKRADGFWEDAETDEDKRARAVELLQEKLAKPSPM
jgi:hypothetical protein